MLRLPFLCPDFLNGHDTGEAGLVFEVLIGADDGAVRLELGGGVAGVVGLEQPLGESGSGFPGIPVGHGVGQVDVEAVPGRSGDRLSGSRTLRMLTVLLGSPQVRESGSKALIDPNPHRNRPHHRHQRSPQKSGHLSLPVCV